MNLQIDSDQQQAASLLREIAAICASHGAQWHPELVAQVREGAMRLLAPPGLTGPLISIPTKLLVPIEGLEWQQNPQKLELHREANVDTLLFTPEQQELLHLQVALYNATGKMQWCSEEHPASLVESQAAIADALRPIKPQAAAGADQPQGEQKPAERFLGTRIYGWQEAPSNDLKYVLLPLIDLMNHHRKGSELRITDGVMALLPAQPDASGECFADYGGRRDGLDLALHYGHLDPSTPFAHSAPLEITLEDFGRIRVKHQGQGPPAHPLDPPRVSFDADGVQLSHLCCHRSHPERAKLMVELALQGALKRRGCTEKEAIQRSKQGVAALGKANRDLLDQLSSIVKQYQHPGAQILAAAARHQSAIIEQVLG